jgi:fructokinase
LTRGDQGLSAWIGEVRIDLGAEQAGDLIDTVGAGDTFMATLLAGLAAQGALTPAGLEALTAEALTAVLRRAATAAAINCVRAGCNPPTLTELDAALASKGAR